MPCRSASRSSAAVATMRASTPSAVNRVRAVSAPAPPISTTGLIALLPADRGSAAGRRFSHQLLQANRHPLGDAEPHDLLHRRPSDRLQAAEGAHEKPLASRADALDGVQR